MFDGIKLFLFSLIKGDSSIGHRVRLLIYISNYFVLYVLKYYNVINLINFTLNYFPFKNQATSLTQSIFVK